MTRNENYGLNLYVCVILSVISPHSAEGVHMGRMIVGN